MKINWREVAIFLFGFYSACSYIVLVIIMNELGTINQRVFITVLLILGLGTIPIIVNKKENEK